jgi:hypothetical protein
MIRFLLDGETVVEIADDPQATALDLIRYRSAAPAPRKAAPRAIAARAP